MSLVSYAGDLGMNSGPAQSVYQLDTSGLRQLPVEPRPLAPGQSIKLPGGDGTLTFTGYRQWISLAITYDPGTLPALIAGMTALAGLLLSFFIRRRRMFVRARPAPAAAPWSTWAASPAPTPPEASRPSSLSSRPAEIAAAQQGSCSCAVPGPGPWHRSPPPAPVAGPPAAADPPAADEPDRGE